MNLLCEKCVEDKELASFIVKKGKRIDACGICKSKNVRAVNCESHDLQSLFKALIRYYFNEWDYNDHWGGESIESVVISSDLIFSDKAKQNIDDLETAILILTAPVYEKYENGISLFAGYSEGLQNRLLEAIGQGNSWTLDSLSARSKSANHYELEDTAGELIDYVLGYVDGFFYETQPLCRARIGYAKKRYLASDGFSSACHYDPYKNESIGAPSPTLAAKGRMNRENVSYLYLASDEETAVAEVRPHPGHIVSVGKFQPTKQLKLADFASANIVNFYQNDKLLDVYASIVAINKLFSIPVPPNFKFKYIVPQLISDLIRQKGFDGISFRSSISDGTNYAFFKPNNFKYVDGSASVVSIVKLAYSYSNADMYDHEKESEYYDPNNL